MCFRKKLESTAQYIYQVLFKEGKNSDITVEALGEEFNLHKVYLCQSPYFASMFGGSWLETTKNYIAIDVVDPLITIQCKFKFKFIRAYMLLVHLITFTKYEFESYRLI